MSDVEALARGGAPPARNDTPPEAGQQPRAQDEEHEANEIVEQREAPVKARPGGDSITVLRAIAPLTMRKTWHRDGTIKPYDTAKNVSVHVERACGIRELSALLQRLEGDPRACIVRGRFVGFNSTQWRAAVRAWGEAPKRGYTFRRDEAFTDEPLHALMIEIDKFEPLTADPIAQPVDAIREFVEVCLPPGFRGVSHHWQLSNSAGHAKSAGQLKAHVWFWLAVPRTSAELKKWATAKRVPIDTAVYQPIQVHYTAAPGFDGVADPVPLRSGFVACERDEVALDAAAVDETVAGRSKPSRSERLADAAERDPVVRLLRERGLVLDGRPRADGALNVKCPNSDQHEIESNETATIYYPPHTGGVPVGVFKCMHTPCRELKRADFLRLLDVENVADEFEVIPGSRDAIDEARRAAQIAENRAIGDGDRKVPVAEKITLESALARFVLIADGSRVADTFAPHFDLALADWTHAYAASRVVRPALRPDGKPKVDSSGVPVMENVPVTRAWATSPARMTVAARTFKAGGPLTLLDPNGRIALNSWRPYDRSRVVTEDDRRKAQMFVEHVEWLWGDSAPAFLDWLAHIEQRPDVLPHTAWLHVARRFGLGRNWICSVLTRLWPGKVAANVNFTDVLGSGFNGALAGKVFAYVDEIREGARDSAWQHAETLKSLLTAETRLINPKYGRQSVEFNSCRWLFLSNHDSAIPIEQSDRRIEVARCDDPPRSGDYYTRLYAALDDAGFVAGVAAVLAERDLSSFNPGAHARLSAAKLDVVRASLTPEAEWCQRAIDYWPSDLIVAADLRLILTGSASAELQAGSRRVLEQYGVKRLDRKIRIQRGSEGTRTTPVWALRNAARWLGATAYDLYAEIEKVASAVAERGMGDGFGGFDPRELVDVLAEAAA